MKVIFSPGSRGGDLSRLSDLIDPIIIEYILQDPDQVAIRRCKLTAEYVVCLVIGLALFGITSILLVGASACLTPGNAPLEQL